MSQKVRPRSHRRFYRLIFFNVSLNCARIARLPVALDGVLLVCDDDHWVSSSLQVVQCCLALTFSASNCGAYSASACANFMDGDSGARDRGGVRDGVCVGFGGALTDMLCWCTRALFVFVFFFVFAPFIL
jgi:hypothetical protein